MIFEWMAEVGYSVLVRCKCIATTDSNVSSSSYECSNVVDVVEILGGEGNEVNVGDDFDLLLSLLLLPCC